MMSTSDGSIGTCGSPGMKAIARPPTTRRIGYGTPKRRAANARPAATTMRSNTSSSALIPLCCSIVRLAHLAAR